MFSFQVHCTFTCILEMKMLIFLNWLKLLKVQQKVAPFHPFVVLGWINVSMGSYIQLDCWHGIHAKETCIFNLTNVNIYTYVLFRSRVHPYLSWCSGIPDWAEEIPKESTTWYNTTWNKNNKLFVNNWKLLVYYIFQNKG